MDDPTTKQVEILASRDAIKMAFALAMTNQLRQWPWGRILAAPAVLSALAIARAKLGL
jgi:hypothetical protein